MCDVARKDWRAWQEQINSCQCRKCNLFKQCSPPARPWRPIREERILFISEAPPAEGGFWAPRPVADKLRQHLLAILESLGLQVPKDHHSCEALYAFLLGGFFLVQAIKWPLIRGFNQLGSKQQRTLVQHSMDYHLQCEIEAIRPRAIIALGNAAWAACARLHQDQAALPNRGVTDLRIQDFELHVSGGRDVLLNVTYLPVDRIMNQAKRAREIQEDICRFLRRMGWNPSQNSD